MNSLNSTYYSLFTLLLFSVTIIAQTETATLTVRVQDEQTGNAIQNAVVTITPCNCGGQTDAQGTFAKVLPLGKYKIKVSSIGYGSKTQKITLSKNTTLRTSISSKNEELSEVFIRSRKWNHSLENTTMGVVKLNTQEIKKIPAALGEVDVLRGVTLLAGVNNAGEVSNGISVRGGSLDQNLLLYDNAPVFNPTHLFGLFSVFTPDAIASSDLYKGNIPSRFGGRAASVMDIKVKEPYVDSLTLKGGIGLVSSRLLVETPIVRNKLTMLAGARAGLTGFLLPLSSNRLKDTKARFVDGTLKLLYLPTKKDKITFTGFYSNDFYQLDLITRVENINSDLNQYKFSTWNGTLHWNHHSNENTNINTTLVGSFYRPKIIFPEVVDGNDIEFSSEIQYISLQSEFSKKVNTAFQYYGGIQANQYGIRPGSLDPGGVSSVTRVDLPKETSYELAAYANVDWKPFQFLNVSAGLRYNYYFLLGPYTLADFDETGQTVMNTTFFERGDLVADYTGLDPRLGINFKLGKTTSIKANYARVHQYLQNVYNSTTPIPTSRWKTADRTIQPQIGNTYSIGLYQNFNNDDLQFTLEGYYKKTDNILSYKPGADFFLEEFLERDIVQGEGTAYGVELSFKKSKGIVNGWFNYTYSRSFLQSQTPRLADRINNNERFPSDFDRPHVFNGTLNIEKGKRHVVSFNLTVQSGRPYSIPNGFIRQGGVDIPLFLERNNSRLPTYHRLDLSWKINSRINTEKRWKSDWTFTIYNIYARNNPVNIYYTQRTGGENGNIFLDSPLGTFELSILNSPLFALTYNFSF